MPVPPNQSFATAIDIGTLSGYTAYETTQDAFDGASVVADLYYKYTPVTGDDMLEIYGYGNLAPNAYTPETSVFTGPLGSEALISDFALSTPMQQDIVTNVVPGEDVFFKFHRTTGDTGVSSILTIRIARGQKQAIVPGDLYINDSSPGFPGIVMNPTTAMPSRYQLNYPAGEGQVILQNGIVAVLDAFVVDGPVLYDVSSTGFTVRATPSMPATGYTQALGTNQTDTFWAVKQNGVSNSTAVSFDEDGVVSSPLDLGANSASDLTPQADNTAVYWVRGGEIKKTTNPGGTMTTFLTVTIEGANIMMMTDDTLLVPVDNGGTLDIRQYNLSASLINTITTSVTSSLLERIFADDEDPTYFWIWWQTSTLNKFQKYRVSDGALITSLSRMKFVEGVSEEGVVIGSTIYSGADFSCVPIVLRTGTTPTPEAFSFRRLRQFQLPSSENNYQMFIGALELLCKTGIGLTPGEEADPPVLGSDPQVMLSISRDGGQTWGPERWMSAGRIGQYLREVRWLRNGRYRNAVVRLVVSDPVDWQLISFMGDITEGSS